jgi:hypothetical protein
MKKQTAVEWLVKKIENNVHHTIRIPNEYFEQAKAMEKEQIVNFLKWIEGSYSFGNVQGLWYEHINIKKQYTTEELYNKYYNETYGGDK